MNAYLEEWCNWNMGSDLSQDKMGNWKIWFGVVCLVLWYRKNNEIFNNKRPKDDAVMDFSRRMHEILYSPAILQESGLAINGLGDMKERWEAPEVGWYKLTLMELVDMEAFGLHVE